MFLLDGLSRLFSVKFKKVFSFVHLSQFSIPFDWTPVTQESPTSGLCYWGPWLHETFFLVGDGV